MVRTSTSVQIQVQIPAPALPTSPSINPSVEWGQHCSFLMGWLNHEVRNRVLLWYLLPALGGLLSSSVTKLEAWAKLITYHTALPLLSTSSTLIQDPCGFIRPGWLT